MLSAIKDFFTALARLTASVNAMADQFDTANEKLAASSADDDRPVLVNGRRKTLVNKD